MTLPQLSNYSDFKAFIAEKDLGLVHFYASWAPSCDQLNTVLGDILVDFPKARGAFIDAEEVSEASSACGITAAPTVVFFKNGKEVTRVNGFQPAEIRQAVTIHSMASSVTATSSGGTENTEKDLNARLKQLIESHRVMLFMKGNRDQPRCGFSRQITELLTGINVDYGTFDILDDDQVRQGLKTYSNWPTFPQLYLDGELLGGLDVVREELQDASFVANLPKKEANDVNAKLKKLVSSHKLMVFMKGDPQQPRCGFSRQVMELLHGLNAEFGTFDILEDEDVRQNLKTFSNWPTYPQIYLDGELVGGLDVFREELEDADFVASLPKKN